MEYISVTGDKILTNPGETIFKYDKSLLEDLIIDPLSYNIIKNPVILNNRIYDKQSIISWLSNSLVDPFTGQNLKPDFKICDFNILKYILLSLENSEDNYIFHANPMDLLICHIIGSYFYGDKLFEPENIQAINLEPTEPNTKKKFIFQINFPLIKPINNLPLDLSINSILSKPDFLNYTDILIQNQKFTLVDFENININIIFKSCKFKFCKIQKNNYIKLINCKIIPLELATYSMPELLLACPITGEKLATCFLTKSGYLANNIILDNFIPEDYKPNYFHDFLSGLYFSEKISLTKIISDLNQTLKNPVINLKTPDNKYYIFPKNIKNNNNNILNYNFDSKPIKNLSEFISDESITYKYDIIMELRELFKIPINPNYSRDFSNLILTNRLFQHFKLENINMDNTNFNNTIFIKIHFIKINFSNTNLTETLFLNCIFDNCNTKSDIGTQYQDCEFYNQKNFVDLFN